MLPSRITQQQVIDYVRNKIEEKPVYLDTETTGLDKTDEVIEIAIVDYSGEVLFESFVRPSKPIPPGASRIHGISNDMVQNSPTWPVLWPQIRSILFNRTIGMYNAEFDLRMMRQSLTNYRLPFKDKLNAFDIMQIYSDFRGVWDPVRRSMKRFRLEDAGRHMGIPIPNSHRARDDTLLTRAVFHAIAGIPYD